MRQCKSSVIYSLSLCAFTKLGKVTVIFVMSVCPSLCLHGTAGLPLDGFSWNLIFGYFLKLCWENSSFIKIWQEWWVLLREYLYIFMIIPHWILLRIRNISDNSCRENQNWHFIFSNFPKNSAIYEIMWKNMVEADRPQMIVFCGACTLHVG